MKPTFDDIVGIVKFLVLTTLMAAVLIVPTFIMYAIAGKAAAAITCYLVLIALTVMLVFITDEKGVETMKDEITNAEIINAQNHNLGERLTEEVYKPSLSMAFTQFKVKVDEDGTKYTKTVNVITYSTSYGYIPQENIQAAIEHAELPTSEVKLIKHLPINNEMMGTSSGRQFLKDHIDSLDGDKHAVIENYVMSSDVAQKTIQYKKVGYDVNFKDILTDIYWKYNNPQHENHASLDNMIESLSELTPKDREYVISKFIK